MKDFPSYDDLYSRTSDYSISGDYGGLPFYRFNKDISFVRIGFIHGEGGTFDRVFREMLATAIKEKQKKIYVYVGNVTEETGFLKQKLDSIFECKKMYRNNTFKKRKRLVS